MAFILIAGGSIAGLLLLVGVIITATSERSLLEDRLGRYLEEEPSFQVEGEKVNPLSEYLNARLESYKWGVDIARELARADIKLKPAEYIALMLLSGLVVGAIAWLIGGRSILFAALGLAFGLFIPRFYIRRQQSNRLIRFSDQLADMLNLMVNGLRAGYSTMQAMEAVSKEMPPPISDEFRRVVQEMQLGLPMERALDNLLRRIPSDDLDLTVAAINVQREVGGNLAEILNTISYTIRERVRIKGEIRVLTTQVMYSGRFLSLMPVIIALILWILNRPYMMLFFGEETRIIGIPVLIFGLFMIIAGYFSMNKIAQIEV